jgi:hypothetical protein
LGDAFTYLLFGPIFNYAVGTAVNCPANPPACSAQGQGKICAFPTNAPTQNCFYTQLQWGQGPIYSGSVAAGTNNSVAFFPNGTYYRSTKSLQRAHLEGAPGLKTYLVLWHWTGQWQVAASSQALGANDIAFTAPASWASTYPYYEWGVYAVQGNGLFFIALSNP